MARQPTFITSASNPLVQWLRKQAADGSAYRSTHATAVSAGEGAANIWLEGEHLCSAARSKGIKPGRAVLSESAWAQRPQLRELAMWAEAQTLLPEALFAQVSGLGSHGHIGYVLELPVAGPLQPEAPSLILDRLQDPGNVGSVMRSAAAFGFRQVIALKGTVALWQPKVLRAGMGAHFGLALHEGVNIQDLTSALSLPLIGTSSHAPQALHEVDLPWPCAWVLGHEGQGVAPQLLSACSQVLRIAQPGGEESLNVAAAAAVCLYESSRQRMAA